MDGTGRSESRVIAWGPDVRGPYGAEQSMARKPMKEHEKRPIKMYIPELNKVCDVTLEARTIEPVLLGDGTKRPLLRVDQTTTVDGKRRPEYDARLYVDRGGPGPQVGAGRPGRHGGLPDDPGGGPGARRAGQVRPDRSPRWSRSPGRSPTPIRRDTSSTASRSRIPSPPRSSRPTPASRSGAQEAGEDAAVLEIKSAGPLDGEPVDRGGRPRIPQAQRAGHQRRRPGPQPGAAGHPRGSTTPGRRPRRSTSGSPRTSGTRTSRSRSPRRARWPAT